MLKYSPSDVINAFDGAKNINSAIKKFLKNDVGNDSKSEKFIKNLRLVLASKNLENKEGYILKHLPDFETHLMVLARYAYVEPVDRMTEQVVSSFADDFNSTYSKTQTGIEIKNADKFKEIVLKVVSLIENGFKEAAIPSSNFMKNVMLFIIFEKEVLEAVIPVIVQT